MSRLLITAFAVLLSSSAAAASTAPPLKGSELLPQARVSLRAAQKAALAKEHGVVIGQELEKEKQGNGLVYTFDIKLGKVVHEVNVDAKTGAIVEDTIDNGND